MLLLEEALATVGGPVLGLGDERRSGEKEGEAAGGEEAPKGLLDVRLTMVHRLELVLSDNALNALWGAAARVKEAFTATHALVPGVF